MKIVGISAYRMDQPFREGTYVCSGGRSADGFDSTLVEIVTDAGLTGWGEMAPLGSYYSAAFAAGARAGIAELGPRLVGCDPRQVARIGHDMDLWLMGHPYVKSAIDMACWDLLGQAAGLPLWALLGGRFGESVALYRSVSQGAPEAMAALAAAFVRAGYRRIQVKVGGDPDEDARRMAAVAAAVGQDVVLFADANGGWRTADALRFLRATRDFAYTLEQPCASYAECLLVRCRCDRPVVLDESIDSLDALVQGHRDGAMDGVTLKISRLGGLTRTRLLRDLAVALGLGVTIEDTGGSDIDTAATAHLMISTPEAARLHTVDFNAWVTVSNAAGMPPCRDGRMTAPDGPGLGLEVRREILGEPFFKAA
jgi:L-alanine-DL-glutamate epimerase-like enolase superfamily enzyme